jgi:redox-sensitive bicupin YhaK (pirin superfamily)
MKSVPTLEGAGVKLKRAFGYHQLPKFDPFLLLDDFHSSNPRDYLNGFPWHPHRGIETITYVLEGQIEHGDSLGNRGVIGPGDVQWMTAGSGIVHQEMPQGGGGGLLWGFQLWANLPAKDKMMDPRYRDIKRDQIPEVVTDDGVIIKIICGEVNGVRGPALDIVIEPEFLDVSVPAMGEFSRELPAGHTVIAYVIEGLGNFDRNKNNGKGLIGSEQVVLFEKDGTVAASALEEDFRFLLISGKPLDEPVAWGGPIVMNTDEELRLAFEEYENGSFLKHRMTR